MLIASSAVKYARLTHKMQACRLKMTRVMWKLEEVTFIDSKKNERMQFASNYA